MEGNSDLLYRCDAVIAGKSSNSLTFGGVRAKVVQNYDLERHLHGSQVYMWVRSLLGRGWQRSCGEELLESSRNSKGVAAAE